MNIFAIEGFNNANYKDKPEVIIMLEVVEVWKI